MIITDFKGLKPKDKIYIVEHEDIKWYYFVALNPTYEIEKQHLCGVFINSSNVTNSTVISLVNRKCFITTDYEEAKEELLRQCENKVLRVKKIYFDPEEKYTRYKIDTLIVDTEEKKEE